MILLPCEWNNENLSSASNAHSEYSRIKWDFFVVFRDIKQVLYDESLERKVSICFIGLLINFLTVWAIITQYHSNVRGISSIAMHLSMIAATAQFLRENNSKERQETQNYLLKIAVVLIVYFEYFHMIKLCMIKWIQICAKNRCSQEI